MLWVCRVTLVLLCGLSTMAAHQAPPASFGPAQVRDIVSASTGATHRVWIVRPTGVPPVDGFPVVYLLDGSWYFPLVADIATLLMRSRDIPQVVIVGVGYQDPVEARRLRVRDFTTPAPASAIPPHFVAWKAEPGGLERFMRFMANELPPIVAAGGRVSPDCRALVGHSLSGLFVLESLLRDPGRYRSYAIGDPSAWWNGNEPLQGIDAFAARLKSSSQPVDVLLAQSTVPGTGPGIDALRAGLSTVDAPRFTLESRRFEGDTHNSMLPGFLAYALRRGLACATR